MKKKRVKRKIKGVERMLEESNVIPFPTPSITIKVNDEENWFTKAIENVEEGKEPFTENEE